jgi:hypothetical protein
MTNNTPGNPQKETGYNRHILKKDTQTQKNDTQKIDRVQQTHPEKRHTGPEK